MAVLLQKKRMSNRQHFTCGLTGFYIRWKLDSIDIKKNTQIVEIGNAGKPITFTYSELKKDLNKSLQKINDYYGNERRETFILSDGGPYGRKLTYPDTIIPPSLTTNDQLLQIKVCLLNFMEEMDNNLFLENE